MPEICAALAMLAGALLQFSNTKRGIRVCVQVCL